ncbi:MAG: hypothetical protein K2N22_06780 [Clostridia bacterium]|nr:hypothetical protein [Clostridia bacterium]
MFKIKKLILKTLAVPMVAAIILATVCALPVEGETSAPEQEAVEQGGFVLSDVSGGAVSLSNETIAPEEYEANGIAAEAIAAKTLTLTYKRGNDTVPLWDWTADWAEGASSTWKSKVVTNYITVTPTSDGAATAKVECFQPFGAKIVIKSTLRQDTSYSASMTCDYVKRISSVSTSTYSSTKNSYNAESLRVGKSSVYFGIDVTEIKYTDGTITPTISNTATGQLTIPSDLIDPYLINIGHVSQPISSTVSFQMSVMKSSSGYAIRYSSESKFFLNFFRAYSESNMDSLISSFRSGFNYYTYQKGHAPYAEFSVTFKGEYDGKVYWQYTVSRSIYLDVESA